MTGEEWLVTLNQLISKTKAGKVDWRHATGESFARASIGDFELKLDYVALRVNQDIVPREDSLALSLCTTAGAKVARIDQEQCKALGHPATFTALKQLFHAVVVEPRVKAIADFRAALGDL